MRLSPSAGKRAAYLLLLLSLLFFTSAVSLAEKNAAIKGPQKHPRTLVSDAVFHSAALERDMHYRVLLPQNYDNGGRFPVLYLLHGIYGDYKNGTPGPVWKIMRKASTSSS